MKILSFFLIILVMISTLTLKSGTVLSELTYPKKILVGEENIIISEKASVFIYSKKDLKFKTSFGSRGEGPQEYMIGTLSGFTNIRLNVSKEKIVVTSLMKATFYSLDGVYKNTIKTIPDFFEVKPLNTNYVVWTDLLDNKKYRFQVLHIADSNLKKLKEFIRIPNDLDAKRGLFYYKKYFGYKIYNNKIYLCQSKDLEIDVFNSLGEKIDIIKSPLHKIKFTEKDAKAKIDQLKVDQPSVYKIFKKKIFFPKEYPAIRTFRVSDNKLYVFTHKTINLKNQCLVFGLKGKLIKDTLVPLKEISLKKWFPFDIKDNKVYQLIENQDTETWELVVIDI